MVHNYFKIVAGDLAVHCCLIILMAERNPEIEIVHEQNVMGNVAYLLHLEDRAVLRLRFALDGDRVVVAKVLSEYSVLEVGQGRPRVLGARSFALDQLHGRHFMQVDSGHFEDVAEELQVQFLRALERVSRDLHPQLLDSVK